MWQLEISKEAGLDLSKLDAATQAVVMDDIHNHVMPLIQQHGNPRYRSNSRTNLWPFRSGRYRVLCKTLYDRHTVLIMEIKQQF